MTISNLEKLSPTSKLKLVLMIQDTKSVKRILREFDNINDIKIDGKNPYEFFVDFCKKRPALTGGKPKAEILQLLESKGSKIVFGLEVVKEEPELEDRAEMELAIYRKNVADLKVALDNLDVRAVSEVLQMFESGESIIIDGVPAADYFYEIYDLDIASSDYVFSIVEEIWGMLWQKTDPDTWQEYLDSENICTQQPTATDYYLDTNLPQATHEYEKDHFNYVTCLGMGVVFC